MEVKPATDAEVARWELATAPVTTTLRGGGTALVYTHTTIPALIARIRQEQAEVERLRGAIAGIAEDCLETDWDRVAYRAAFALVPGLLDDEAQPTGQEVRP